MSYSELQINQKDYTNDNTFFSAPKISDNSTTNGYNMTSDSYKIYQSIINASIPTLDNLNAISSNGMGTNEIPGPATYINNAANLEKSELTGRAGDLSLCAQNFSTMSSGTGNGSIASSLLPNGGNGEDKSMAGFSDCDTQNILANNAFLSVRSGGLIGTDTVAGSLRNANQSIRSDPPNPMLYVGPWQNSTIYPDLIRRPLEGCGPSFGMYGNGQDSSGNPVPMNSGV